MTEHPLHHLAVARLLFAFRRRGFFVRRWRDYQVWSFHRCDMCAWRINLGKIGIGRYRSGF